MEPTKFTLDDLIASRRPRALARREYELEREELSNKKEIVEMEDGKRIVVEEWVMQVTTRHICIREYDPEKNYGDAINEFVNPEEVDEPPTTD